MTVTTVNRQSPAVWPPRITASSLWELAVFVAVLLAVVTPLLFLVLGSFSQARLPAEFSFARLGLSNYIKVWGDPATYAVMSNTLWFALGSTAYGILVAAALAWLVERTNIPGKIWIYAGVPMTLAMPGMLQAMAWVLLASPRIGFINKGLMDAFGLSSPPFNIYTLPGMIFIEGLRMVPTAFLMLVPLLRSMDPSLEEAAAMSGARPASALRKVTLGLMLPGLLAVGIYQFTTALEQFEVPGILGLPANIYVFSTKIYAVLNATSSLPAYGEANALAMLYLLVAALSIYAYSRVISKSERFTVITGKGYRPRLLSLGRWRWPAFGLVLLYLALSTIIPFLVLAYASFLPYLQAPSARAFTAMSWDNYLSVFQTERIGRTLWNTAVMTLAVATSVVIISFLVSVVVVRSKFWGRKILDQLAFLPHAIPGMVMGLALLWVFLQIDKLGAGLFGSLTSLIIAFTIGYISYGTRVMNAAVLQVHKDLEEAAKVSGAPQWRVFWRVFFPLLQPAFVGVWIWTVLHVVRSAGKPLILTSGAENEVLAALIWNMWDQGSIEAAAAIGTLLMLGLLAVSLLMRQFGFGRGAHIQEAR
ncbi:MAG TPA: iron ABC transporter permease [Xanthobacteraceae bacterium]|nr:iron ABC transporter permease [Xanthobacteraceae bacterium]